MPIPVHCACGKTLNVPEKHAGKKGKCPACGAVVDIPSLSAAPPARPPAPRGAKRSGRPLVLAATGVVVLGAAAAGIWFFVGRGANPPPSSGNVVAQAPSKDPLPVKGPP